MIFHDVFSYWPTWVMHSCPNLLIGKAPKIRAFIGSAMEPAKRVDP